MLRIKDIETYTHTEREWLLKEIETHTHRMAVKRNRKIGCECVSLRKSYKKV